MMAYEKFRICDTIFAREIGQKMATVLGMCHLTPPNNSNQSAGFEEYRL
jgi:hypothetical protein